MSSASIDEILHFWFEELSRKDWFRKDEALDSTIASRFGAIYHELRDGVPAAWLDTPEGVLAAILVLDQFPRNMFRGDARAFATDEVSLELAKRAIADGFDEKLTRDQRVFLYMPFQHSEDRDDQARAIALYAMLGKPISISRSGIRRWSIASIGSRTATRFSGAPRPRRSGAFSPSPALPSKVAAQ